jgi:uncharacterized protein with HEPN domain
MKPERSADYLGHMIDAARDAMSYVDGMDKADFLADRRTQQAVLHNIMVIGEAATQLGQIAPALLAACPDVPWQSLRGMRNRIAHGYFEINLDLVWTTLQTAMPALLPPLLAARQQLKGK